MVTLNAEKTIVVVFLSLALYNFLELVVQISTTFKRRNGLYFWSFTVATCGVAFNAVGYLLKHLKITNKRNAYATVILIGWCTMITGQSVVLYSRLHIVMRNPTRLRAVLIMIIANATWLHIPVIVLVYGVCSDNPKPFEKPYSIYEKIQLSVFVVQELIISGLYVWETTGLLKPGMTIGNNSKETRNVLHHLIYVNILVILLDFSILGLEFADQFELQTAWKPLVYSIKLKLEFSILNRLVEMTRNSQNRNFSSYGRNVARSEDLVLGPLRGMSHRRSVAPGVEQTNEWKVHVGSGSQNSNTVPSTVMKTTEFRVQSHSRGMSSTSLADSDQDILAHSAVDEA